MSDAHEPRPWFRSKEIGGGWTPATWQGWLITAAFVVLIVATMRLVMPEPPRAAVVFPWLAAARRDLGVPATGFGMAGAVLSVGLELGAFLVVAWRTSRPTKPLD